MPAAPACRNCGTALAGRWCQACGQDSTLALRPWRELLAEWGDAVLGWETRTGRTLRALLLEPGRLTVEFAAGRRAAWVHPLRLYLGASIAAFAAFRLTSATVVARYSTGSGAEDAVSFFGALLLEVSAAMVLLLPAAAGCYAIAFHRRDRYYAEHLVFVLHTTSFGFLAHAAASLVQYPLALADAPVHGAMAARVWAHVVVGYYAYAAAHRAYGYGGWITLLRLVAASALFMPMFFVTLWLIRGSTA